MPLLNDATAVYLGGTPAQAVYAGDVQVWPSGPFTDSVTLIGQYLASGSRDVSAGHVGDRFFDALYLVGAYRPAADQLDQNGRNVWTFATPSIIGSSIAIQFADGTITDPMVVTDVNNGIGGINQNGRISVDHRAWDGLLPGELLTIGVVQP